MNPLDVLIGRVANGIESLRDVYTRQAEHHGHAAAVVRGARELLLCSLALSNVTASGCYGGLEAFERNPLLDPSEDEGDASGSDDDGGETEGEPEPLDPGRVTMRRLTNAEYANTIRDLFYGLELELPELPADEVSLGFDNIADVQSMTPVLFELYDRAAEQALAQALASDVRDLVFTCEPVAGAEAACAEEILRAFGKRAWRRPLTEAEVGELVALVEGARAAGNELQPAIALGLQALLVSPYFLFRVELDPDPSSLVPHPLGDHELATRLSYFVWSTMPDDELTGLADAGLLRDPDVLAAQVGRMLDDERAAALVDDFAGQWLYLRNLGQELAKDQATFPEFDAELQASMKTEAELFVRSFITEDRSLRELLTAEDTFVDARLAAHYGLPIPPGEGFTRVSLAGAPRRGLLTQAGLLSVLSHAAVTSPVKRGKWVLEQLMCFSPPPPPPGVETPPFEPDDDETVREQLERHRTDPTCAACHALMDPIGLGLEHYDAIGRYREQDAGQPIDASGTLPDGERFDGALEMTARLADGDEFAACTVRKTLTYALGRETSEADAPYLDAIVADFQAADMTLEGLLVAVVTSDAFCMRRGEEQG